jgi:hypothetical protein
MCRPPFGQRGRRWSALCAGRVADNDLGGWHPQAHGSFQPGAHGQLARSRAQKSSSLLSAGLVTSCQKV